MTESTMIKGMDKIPNWEKTLVIEAGPSNVNEKNTHLPPREKLDIWVRQITATPQ